MDKVRFGRYVLHSLCGNGWKWEKALAEDDYEVYTLQVLSLMYDVICYAYISVYEKHLKCDGHYGVLWLGVKHEYQDENESLSESDLRDMLYAFEIAEENLIRCGVPFTPDYKFHGRNKANMKRRNDTLRRKLGLEELEKAGDEE